MANPRFEPTDEERRIVKGLAAYGLKPAQIIQAVRRPKGYKGGDGELYPISVPTLKKYFREELETAEMTANNNVAKALYDTAVDRSHKNHVQAAIFWLQARAGWKTQAQVTADGSIDLALDPEALAGLSPEELAGVEKVLMRKARMRVPTAANAA